MERWRKKEEVGDGEMKEEGGGRWRKKEEVGDGEMEEDLLGEWREFPQGLLE